MSDYYLRTHYPNHPSLRSARGTRGQHREKTPKSEPFLEELRELGLGGSWIILQKDSTTWYGPYETEDQGRDRLGQHDSLGCAIRGRVVQVPKYAPLAISKTT